MPFVAQIEWTDPTRYSETVFAFGTNSLRFCSREFLSGLAPAIKIEATESSKVGSLEM